MVGNSFSSRGKKKMGAAGKSLCNINRGEKKGKKKRGFRKEGTRGREKIECAGKGEGSGEVLLGGEGGGAER